MSNATLCMSLMRADTETEVISILRNAGYWDNPFLWRPLGDDDNNFATIGNQQSEAIAALIEKIVNGVDARLIDACLRAGVDPEGPAAPQSVRAAVSRFFEGKADPTDHDGRIAEWPSSTATAQGRLLTVSATGHMPMAGKPSISIADQGEGQTPDSFPDTFMSLHRSNKLRIPFVQGKFNMGGTGALQFCGGDSKVQLVVSRRDPALLGNTTSERDREWGFTVVRREPPAHGSRSSVFTYLAPVGDGGEPRAVLSFTADEWPIFPEADDMVRDAYARVAPYGSLIKLYEYEWHGTRSNIVSSGAGLLRLVDIGLPDLALPVRLFECRPGYKGHRGSFATNALGLVARLDENRSENLEPESPIGGILAIDGRQIKLRVYVFRPNKAKQYRVARHGIVFTVNGQMHGTFKDDFFRRRAVGLGYLADSTLVVADCTDIKGQMREDLFMNSRDRLRNTPLERKLEAGLEEFLRTEKTLRELQNRLRQAALANRLQDDKPFVELLQELLNSNPMLSKLLFQGFRLAAPFPPGGGLGEGTTARFEGKRFPTVFRFRGRKDYQPYTRTAFLESKVHVSFETDAEDSYFVRDFDPGAWSVRVKVGEAYVDAANWTTTGPKNGVAHLSIDHLPLGTSVEERVEYLIEVTDISRIEPFTNHLILIAQAGSPHGGGKGERIKGGNKGKGNIGGGSLLALPEVKTVTEEHWGDPPGFNEESALKVVATGLSSDSEVYDFFVNVDNKYLRIAQKEPKSNAHLLEKQFTYGLVLVGLAMLQDHQQQARKHTDADGHDDDGSSIEDVIETTTRALAPILLPLIEAIGGLSADDL
ncbi:MAG: hypothetical protein ACRDOL_28175 [Streptosporangiaceae bacterium]